MDKCKDCIHNPICTVHQQFYSIKPDPHCGHHKPITDMISRESALMGYSLFATYIFDEIEKIMASYEPHHTVGIWGDNRYAELKKKCTKGSE